MGMLHWAPENGSQCSESGRSGQWSSLTHSHGKTNSFCLVAHLESSMEVNRNQITEDPGQSTTVCHSLPHASHSLLGKEIFILAQCCLCSPVCHHGAVWLHYRAGAWGVEEESGSGTSYIFGISRGVLHSRPTWYGQHFRPICKVNFVRFLHQNSKKKLFLRFDCEKFILIFVAVIFTS